MKIAVCAIAKNEAKHIERWAESCVDADYRFILDTGSTDDTVTMAQQTGVTVAQQVFNPWRFDHARNAVWDHLPDDIDFVVWLDMDEVLIPGWREALEAIPAGTTRPRYKYVWSWKPDGTEGLVYGGDKICTRHNYTWVHPCHEVLTPVGINEVTHWVDGLEIHHHPDPTKSRAQYFDLLKLAVEERPHDDRNQYYLAREYYFHGEYGLAQYHFKQFLMLSNWAPERAAARRYIARMRPGHEEPLLYQAVEEDPNRRENWFELAVHYYNKKDWRAVVACCEMMFRITEKPLDYLCDANAWGADPYDYMAIACYHLQRYDEAREYGMKALELRPDDPRLRDNMKWYTGVNEPW